MSNPKKYADKAVTIMKKQCKKKTNKLIYADNSKTRGKCNVYVPKISKTCGTRIRYCTAKELKLMTQRVCECPSPAGHFGLSSVIWSALQNAAKFATIAAVTYLTYDMGFWGDTRVTEHTFASMCETMPCTRDPCKRYEFKARNMECEATKELLKIPSQDPCACDDSIPDLEKCSYKMKQLWNHTVIFIFEGIVNAPGNIIDYIKNKMNNSIPQECDPCKPLMKETMEKDGSCALYDDYDEKYPPEEECEDAEAELAAFIENEEDDLPSCGY